jgi:hypothetical protein
MFVSIGPERTIRMQYVDMYMICLYSKFYIPISTGSLAIAKRLNANDNIWTGAMFLIFNSQNR